MASAGRDQRTTLKRGNAAMEALKQEQERAEARREAANTGVYRFYITKDTRGKYQTHEVVILDDDARNAPFAHEHTVAGPGGNMREARTHICVDEVDNCVLCRAKEGNLGEEFKHAAYNMYTTIGDLLPYTIKNGARSGQVIDYTRKLMVIPSGSVATFMKIFELCFKQHGTTRGMVLRLTKDKQMDPRCGIPQMMDNGMLFEMMTEEELDDYFNDAYVKDGKTIKEEGEDIEPIDYERELAPPDQRLLRKLYNLPASVGSEDEEQEETGQTRRQRRRGDGAGQADAEAEQPARRRTRGRTGAQERDQGDGGEDAPETQDAPPARRRTRAAPETQDAEPEAAPRRRSRAAPPPDDTQDAPPPAGRRGRTGTVPNRSDYDDEIPF